MELVTLGTIEMAYESTEVMDYGAGGQFYGTLRGTLSGDRLNGALHLTNLAVLRPDGVNEPTARGLIRVPDGDPIWVQIDGLATLRDPDRPECSWLRSSCGPFTASHPLQTDRSDVDTRELEEPSRAWVEDDLTTAFKNFINEVGRLPRYGELTVFLKTGRHPDS